MTTNLISQFILASASPRRRDLLRKAGYCFEIVPSGVDESAYSTDGITSEGHTKILALAKAKDVAKRFPNAIVMGSDTVVDLDGEYPMTSNGKYDRRAITELVFG